MAIALSARCRPSWSVVPATLAAPPEHTLARGARIGGRPTSHLSDTVTRQCDGGPPRLGVVGPARRRREPHSSWSGERCGAAARGAARGFYICASCYRGQRYCGAPCRATAQRRQRRQANARHQRSPEGRLDHRDRQRAYRARCRLRRVTDTPSPGRPRSPTIAPRPRTRPNRPVCLVCGRVWAPRDVTTRGHPRETWRDRTMTRRKAPDDGHS